MTTDQTEDELSELLRHEQLFFDGRGVADPETRRRRRRTGLLITGAILLILFGAPTGYAAWALNAPLPEPSVDFGTPAVPATEAATIALPQSAASAISISGADEYLGADASGIWASSGTDEARSIASVTKLITALVVLEAHPLESADDPGPTIVFGEAAHDLYDEYYVRGATIAAMPAGTAMSLHDAIGAMLIPSASNYAHAVSTWAFGSQGAFLDAARAWLSDHGLTGTTIVDPTGLDPRNTSTPGDMLALGKIAAAHPAIAAIARMPSLNVPGAGTMINTNSLLGSHGITGLKTGNLGAGRFSLLYTASLAVGADERLAVTGVILDGASRAAVNQAVGALLESIEAGFHRVPVAERGQRVGVFTTPWGSEATAVIAQDAAILTWSDTPIAVSVDATAPERYAEGETIGTITWTAGPQTETVDIVVEGEIAPPTEWWRLTHPGDLAGW